MTTSPLDLWTPRYPVERLHPHFRALAARPSIRDSLSRWADGFIDADNKIVNEFQTCFSSAFWELYLHAMFKSFGFGVTRPKDHPDFSLATPQGEIVAEAKVTEAGPSQVPESTPKHTLSYDQEQFYSQTTAKLCGAFKSKSESIRGYLHEPHVKDRPILLCLTPFDHPYFPVQHARAIWRVLYQYDQPIGYISESGQLIETGYFQTESFRKQSGASVELGCFLNPANAHISAVFFNPRATVGKLCCDPQRIHHERERVYARWYVVSTGKLVPQDVHPSVYRETLADGGYLLLNPHASHPVNPDSFFSQGVTICDFNPDTRIMYSHTPATFLFERVTAGVLPDDYPSELTII